MILGFKADGIGTAVTIPGFLVSELENRSLKVVKVAAAATTQFCTAKSTRGQRSSMLCTVHDNGKTCSRRMHAIDSQKTRGYGRTSWSLVRNGSLPSFDQLHVNAFVDDLFA